MQTKSAVISAALIGLSPISALAAPILSEASITVTSGNIGETPNVDINDDDSPGGDAEVGSPFFGNHALQQADGISDVEAQSFEGDGFDLEMVTSEATLTQGETNNSGASRDYFLDFELQALDAFMVHVTDALDALMPPIVNPFGATASDIITSGATAASFEYFIKLGNDVIYSTRADAVVSENTSEITGTGAFLASATLGPAALGAPFGETFDFSVAPLSGSIALGSFDDGESVTVTSGVIARAYSHGGLISVFDENDGCFESFNGIDERVTDDIIFEECGFFAGNGASGFFSDPVNIYSVGTLSSVPTNPAPVPLPAAGWMLIAGVGGLMAAGRRKRA